MPTGDGHSQLAHWLVGHVPRARDTRVRVTVKFRPLSRFEGALRARPHWSGPTVAAHSMRSRRCHRATGHGRWRQSHQGSSATPSPACRAGRCLLRTAQRTRASSSIVDVFVISKLLRANGGCLGDYYRRRTWVAAKSHGEPPTGLRPVDVRMGKPGTRHGVSLPPEHIGRVEGTG